MLKKLKYVHRKKNPAHRDRAALRRAGGFCSVFCSGSANAAHLLRWDAFRRIVIMYAGV